MRHFDPPADALQPPSLPRKLSDTAFVSSHDAHDATSHSFAGDTGSQVRMRRYLFGKGSRYLLSSDRLLLLIGIPSRFAQIASNTFAMTNPLSRADAARP